MQKIIAMMALSCLISLPLQAALKFKGEESVLFNFSDVESKLFQPGAGSRPCCAFGTDIRFRYFPLILIDQIMGGDELTNHNFGASDRGEKEVQGEIFTCRAGFLDSSHMRHAADWTAYIAVAIEKMWPMGGTIDLLYEGGKRSLTINPVSFEYSKEHIVALAQRIAYDTTVWHEIITWFVPAVIPIFSEKSSSFAPEDNFSNLLGTYVAAKALLSEGGYNHEVTRAFGEYLSAYQAQDRATTKAAFKLVADEWYQEKSRIPDPWKTLKRHLNSYPEVTPWIHPKASVLGCAVDVNPVVTLQVPEYITLPDGSQARLTDMYELKQIAHKKIPVDFLLEKESAQKQLITHRDFPQVVKKIGELIRQAYADKGFASPDL